MVDAANLVAFPVIGAGFLDQEPRFIEPARNGVFLDAERGNVPAVDDALRNPGNEHSHRRAGRNDQRVVNTQQTYVAGFQILFLDQVAVEFEPVLIGILVGPEPLVPGDLDRHVGVGHPVHVIDQLERRDRDDDEDQDRDDGPQKLNEGIVRGAGRYRFLVWWNRTIT